jgi:hypothetical protein
MTVMSGELLMAPKTAAPGFTAQTPESKLRRTGRGVEGGLKARDNTSGGDTSFLSSVLPGYISDSPKDSKGVNFRSSNYLTCSFLNTAELRVPLLKARGQAQNLPSLHPRVARHAQVPRAEV